MEDIKYMVRVSCMTFNHAHYIADAMNGFCMQETNFPFVCTIIDDCSTDGEQDVIKNYLEEHFDLENSSIVRNEETDDYYLTFAQHKTNKNCYFAVLLLKYNHYSIRKPKKPYIEEWCDTKYIALCEGDDYWIGAQKLQKQVDFLETHMDYTMCFHNTMMKREADVVMGHTILDELFENRDYEAPEFISHRPPTASLVFRSNITFPKDKRFLFGDNVVFLTCATTGKVRCLGEVMSVYRRHSGGVMLSVYRPFIKRIENRYALMEHFPSCSPILKYKMGEDIIMSLLKKRERNEVVNYLWHHPKDIKYLFVGLYVTISKRVN